MSKRKRRRKKIPEFRPYPLKRKRVKPDDYDKARFYGNYETMRGKIKRASFMVKVDLSTTRKRRLASKQIAFVIVRGKYQNEIPLHTQGQIFISFGELLRSPWMKVKKIREYKAGVLYA